MSSFDVLNSINVNDKIEKKNGLTYLTWSWAWAAVKKKYPDASYEIYRAENGLPYVYDPLTGYMVYTSVTIEGQTHMMWLPVMDGANKAMKAEPYDYWVKNPYFKYAKKADDGKYYDRYGKEQPEYSEKHCEAATMFDVNKSIMRCLVKNLAMFGLGLYIYAGEDLPEEEQTPKAAAKTEEPQKEKADRAEEKPEEHRVICECCGSEITDCEADGKKWTKNQIIRSGMKFNQHLCYKCLSVVAKQEAAKKALLADAEAHSA